MYNDLSSALIQDKVISNYKPQFSTIDQYFNYLKSMYSFGSESFATPKYNRERKIIFDIALRPLLQFTVKNNHIDMYSKIDHNLFKSYICPIEDIKWFEQAFWDVNSYGLSLARTISKQLQIEKPLTFDTNQRKRLLFVFKGPFSLAHSNVLRDFLDGFTDIQTNTDVHLLLLDNNEFKIKNINVISFSGVKSTLEKLKMYITLCQKYHFYNIIWVACVQNLSLYMGLGLATEQTYWTMKRHSIIFPEITKYATFISQYRNKIYNEKFWYGGRYRLKAIPSRKEKKEILHGFDEKTYFAITNNFVFGSLARDQKYQNLEYWQGIELLLSKSPKSIFIYGSNALSKQVYSYIKNSMILSQNSINFGWLKGNTADIASLIQIYIDTIPFGSGLTAAECVLSNGCYLGVLSEINKEASFTNILVDAYNLASNKKIEYNKSIHSYGIFADFKACIKYALQLRNSPETLLNLHSAQKKLLLNLDSVGAKYFTPDYLKYFAGEHV